MPELPEVEITRRRLVPVLVGRTIAAVRTTPPSYLFLTPPRRLVRALVGRTITGLARHGKYLVTALDDGGRLVVHLGMTGQVFADGVASPRLLSAAARAALAPQEQVVFRPDAHTHLRMRFADAGPSVYLRDVRKFGKVLHLLRGEAHPRLARLGPDALRARGEALFRASRGRTLAAKSLLLDQSVFAGVGNIYADEALFGAAVRPARRAGSLTRPECERIVRELKRVIRRSIATGGSSISDYVAPDGSDGRYQDERRVYGRAGQACRRCNAPIRRIVVGQRATHYCACCQG